MAKYLILGSLQSVWQLPDGVPDHIVLEELAAGAESGKPVSIYAKVGDNFQQLMVNPSAVPCWAVIETDGSPQ